MKNERWVFYKDIKAEKGDTMLKMNDVVHGCVCLEDGILLDIFNPYRKDFVKD